MTAIVEYVERRKDLNLQGARYRIPQRTHLLRLKIDRPRNFNVAARRAAEALAAERAEVCHFTIYSEHSNLRGVPGGHRFFDEAQGKEVRKGGTNQWGWIQGSEVAS